MSYCNGEMGVGILEGGRYLLWVKQPHKVSYHPKAGEVLLGEKAVMFVVVNSYICKHCKKIIIDYANLNGVKEEIVCIGKSLFTLEFNLL
ncbi:MAG: PF20097 family protein [Xylanivirga thermophila]|jgi:hypothetical protein|uniref:PF20097 family protein n=1 Tax=Xylanivirga thermophila TaxID=2496273 RepID=UPI0039F5377F